MKKYAVILLLVLNSVCFAQNSMNIKFKFNKIETHIKGKLKIAKSPLYTLIILRKDKVELYKEVVFNFNNNMYLKPALGWDYDFKTKHNSPRVKLDLVGDFDKFFFKVVYGSDIATRGISTRLEYKLTNRFYSGIQSSNQFIGPRVDYKFLVFHQKEFKLGVYYLFKDDFGFSFRFNIFEMFPKLKKKREIFQNWINRKTNKNNKKQKANCEVGF